MLNRDDMIYPEAFFLRYWKSRIYLGLLPLIFVISLDLIFFISGRILDEIWLRYVIIVRFVIQFGMRVPWMMTQIWRQGYSCKADIFHLVCKGSLFSKQFFKTCLCKRDYPMPIAIHYYRDTCYFKKTNLEV